MYPQLSVYHEANFPFLPFPSLGQDIHSRCSFGHSPIMIMSAAAQVLSTSVVCHRYVSDVSSYVGCLSIPCVGRVSDVCHPCVGVPHPHRTRAVPEQDRLGVTAVPRSYHNPVTTRRAVLIQLPSGGLPSPASGARQLWFQLDIVMPRQLS